METTEQNVDTSELDILEGRVEMTLEQSMSVLTQLWDSALRSGAITNSQDAILIQKAFETINREVNKK